jgi:drug/metabolite transporter (DMT)-like permease
VKSRAALPYWWMLIGAFFFSWMSILAHELRLALPWQSIALVRTSVAFLLAVLLTWQAGASFAVLRPPTLWIRSIAGSLSLTLAFYALTHTNLLAEVLVLANMFPIWVAILSWPVLGSLPRWDVWVAIVCALAGVVLIARPQTAAIDASLVAAALSSLTTAVAMLGLHKLHELDPRAIVAHFSAVSVLFCLAAILLFPSEIAYSLPRDGFTLAMLTGVGISATIGQLFLTKAFAAGSPARVSVVGLTQVAFTAVPDIFYWHRTIEPQKLAGMALILAPTAWLLVWGVRGTETPIIAEDEVVPPPIE